MWGGEVCVGANWSTLEIGWKAGPGSREERRDGVLTDAHDPAPPTAAYGKEGAVWGSTRGGAHQEDRDFGRTAWKRRVQRTGPTDARPPSVFTPSHTWFSRVAPGDRDLREHGPGPCTHTLGPPKGAREGGAAALSPLRIGTQEKCCEEAPTPTTTPGPA